MIQTFPYTTRGYCHKRTARLDFSFKSQNIAVENGRLAPGCIREWHMARVELVWS